MYHVKLKWHICCFGLHHQNHKEEEKVVRVFPSIKDANWGQFRAYLHVPEWEREWFGEKATAFLIIVPSCNCHLSIKALGFLLSAWNPRPINLVCTRVVESRPICSILHSIEQVLRVACPLSPSSLKRLKHYFPYYLSLLKPFTDTRYHILDFQCSSQKIRGRRKHFDKRHSSSKGTIESAFEV